MKTRLPQRISILFVGIIVLGCEPSSINSLTPEVRYMADTIFARKKIKLEKEMDSICLAQKDQFIAHAVDSLVKINEQRILELSR